MSDREYTYHDYFRVYHKIAMVENVIYNEDGTAHAYEVYLEGEEDLLTVYPNEIEDDF